VPTLAVAHTDDPIAYPRVAFACTKLARRQHPTLLLTHLEHVALAELRRETAASNESAGAGVPSRVWRRLYQRGPAVRAVEQSVAVLMRMPQRERDRAFG
jgi:hypothetical protein